MNENTEVVRTVESWNTGYCADSVEWCPVHPHHAVFVCGTYQLEKNEESTKESGADTEGEGQKRLGKLYLFYVDKNAPSLDLVQTIETKAILDLKWCHQSIDGSPYLGLVNAGGILLVYKLLKEEEKYQLDLVMEMKISEEIGVLALSLDWSTGRNKFEEPQIVISDSNGNISVCLLGLDKTISKSFSWKAHGFEAWICAFDYWNPSVIYTGGDDCIFKVFDLRCGTDATIVNRSHEAGVTSLHANSHQEHILASGSYDENLRIWDTRKMKMPIVEDNLGGGIWRLKWDPERHNTLLAACMYGGFRVVHYNQSTLNIIAEYREHDSIGYGADWCHDTFSSKESIDTRKLIATCSFYDCKLNLAEIKY